MATRRNWWTISGCLMVVVGLIGLLATFAVIGSSSERDEAAQREREGTGSVTIVTDGPGSGASTDPAADDGELHDARRTDVPYQMREQFWARDDVETLKAYDLKVQCQFSVRFPQLEGDLAHKDEVNALLEKTAKEFVRTYYDDPGSREVARVHEVIDGQKGNAYDEEADALLASEVSYAITYNTEDFISVCFSDTYYVGSWLLGFVELRTVNVDLRTGEAYELDDVLSVNEALATTFVDNLVRTTGIDQNEDGQLTDDECLSVRLVGREALVEAVQGKGTLVDEGRVSRCFFVDGNGKVNLGVNYWLTGDDGFVRGWWDVTVPDEQLAAVRREAGLWELL